MTMERMVLNEAFTSAFAFWPRAAHRPASPVKISFKINTQAHWPQKKPSQALKPANKWCPPPKSKGNITTVPSNQRQNVLELISGCTARRARLSSITCYEMHVGAGSFGGREGWGMEDVATTGWAVGKPRATFDASAERIGENFRHPFLEK